VNQRQNSLEIAPEIIAALPSGLRELGEALNHRLRTIAELQEAGAGLRGTVEIVSQKKTDERGATLPGIDLRTNRAAALADPVDDQDLATLGYLLRYLDCRRIVDILDECADFPDAVDDEIESVAAAGGTFTHFWGYRTTIGHSQASQTFTANQARAWRFVLPYDIIINKAVMDVTALGAGVASLGLYDKSGNLVLDSGTFSVASTGIKTVTLGTAVRLLQEEYHLALTANIAFSHRSPNLVLGGHSQQAMANKNVTREGTGTATSGGVLNATLGALTRFAVGTTVLPPMCLFET